MDAHTHSHLPARIELKSGGFGPRSSFRTSFSAMASCVEAMSAARYDCNDFAGVVPDHRAGSRLRSRLRSGTLIGAEAHDREGDEMEIRSQKTDWVEVYDYVTSFTWGFSIERNASGRRRLSGPAPSGWGGGWPNGNQTELARLFAQIEATRLGLIDD